MVREQYDFFADFKPVIFKKKDDEIFCLKRNHGVSSNYVLHNIDDVFNENNSFKDISLIEYRIGDLSYNLFSIDDFNILPYEVSWDTSTNIMGEIRERISRRITKYFLRHFDRDFGKPGGLFNKKFNKDNKDNFNVNHSDNYILKIKNYPNMVILKQGGEGLSGYVPIKELDGLFDYRYKGEKTLIVMESKFQTLNLKSNTKSKSVKLIDDLFVPLKELFPDRSFYFLLFADKNAIIKRNSKYNEIKKEPLRIYDFLKKESVDTLFFTFNEKEADYFNMCSHIINQYNFLNKKKMNFNGRVAYSPVNLDVFYNGSKNPLISLKKIGNGLWKEK
ncbi:hypothetical protein K9L67_03495 [Candidatus Woesearchaeota archaeon]|nr:hypothetical protein [Candidatus Woesearchaeota archaeon]MCF7901267.1 hypothetical protein [Candidatus Woesearchaeota archaeon]MCF8013566.1 hypothetical protein [Candidatus Woesearchaeota archaeon]